MFEVLVFAGTLEIDAVDFDTESEAIVFASEKQDEGYTVRVMELA